MKKVLYSLVAISIVYSCAPKEKPEIKTSEAAQIYYNGEVLTMDSDTPTYVESVVAQNGKIVFTRNLKEGESKFRNAQKINLEGKTLMPGFIDPHSHFGMVSNSMGQVDLNSEP